MRLLFVFVLSVCALMNIQGQAYSSKKYLELRELMTGVNLPKTDTAFGCTSIIKNKLLVVKYDEYLQVKHLGLSLFSNETKELLNLPICNFIERMLLELVLQKNSSGVQARLREYKIVLKRNDVRYGAPTFTSLNQVLNNIQHPTQFTIHKDSCFTACWEYGNDEVLKMSFPASYELIYGMDKKEMDVSIGELFDNNDCQRNLVSEDSNIVLKEELLPVKGTDLYLRKGSVFMDNRINSDIYCQRIDSTYQVAFAPDYPVESLANLFLTNQIMNSLALKITHRMYGGFTPEFIIPLNRFACLFEKEFSTYCILHPVDSGKIQLSVVLHNWNFNYVHLLRIRTTTQQLFQNNGILIADFYTNIPLNNLKNLFM